MNARLRQERTGFLLFFATILVTVLLSLPVMLTAGVVRDARAQGCAPQVSFESLDRNRDGYVDKVEFAKGMPLGAARTGILSKSDPPE